MPMPFVRSMTDEELNDDEKLFQSIFPKPTGPATREKAYRKAEWNTLRREFLAFVPLDFDPKEISHFIEYGMGKPVGWRSKREKTYMTFPDAEFPSSYRLPYQGIDVLRNVGFIVQEYQFDAIMNGYFIPFERWHPYLQGVPSARLSEQNRINRDNATVNTGDGNEPKD